MKKILSSLLIICLLILLSGCGIFNLNNFTIPNDIEFMEMVASLDTPEKIGNYMEDNFIYVAAPYKAVSPYELWKVGEGDCNDFTCFGTFVANYNGYKTYQILIAFYGISSKHYIGIYVEDIYSFTDNQKYYYGFDTFRDIVDESGKHTYLEWKKYEVYDYDNNLIEVGEK